MKKLLIFLAIVLLAGAGYLTYEKWVKHANIEAWSFIPSDAAVVFEFQLTKDLDSIKRHQIWSTFKETDFAKIEKSILFLDTINGANGFSSIFQRTPALISAHRTSRTEVDFLFVLDVQDISQNTFINATIGTLKEKGYRFKTRRYNDFTITEISKGSTVFTCIFFQHFFLASFSPYLVEDAIRTISEKDLPSFQEKMEVTSPANAFGSFSVYLNYDQSQHLLKVFSSAPVEFPKLYGAYQVNIDTGYIHLAGTTYGSGGYFSIYHDPPSTFDMIEIVPENAASVYHFTNTERESWKTKQMQYIRLSPNLLAYQDSIRNLLDFHVEQVFDLLDKEMAVIHLESNNSKSNTKLFALETKDIGESLSFFGKISKQVAQARGDSVYSESYSENEIRFFPVKDFPRAILGDLASGFDQCFYMSIRNFLIFSNDLEALKTLLESVQDENTWAKSLQVRQFLDQCASEANISLFVNVSRAWSNASNNFTAGWKSHALEHERDYKSIELAAFQYSSLEGNFFTNFTISQPTKIPKHIPKTDPESGIRFSNDLITKPYLVKSHLHRRFDIMLQDASNTLYYLDQNKVAQWSRLLEAPLSSDVFEVDFYRNGKIQYAFASSTHVHIIDRLGDYIPGYPKSLQSDSEIDHFSVIDYDRSRNYRFSITDKEGNVYLTDKELNVLEGWAPNNLNRRAIAPLRHARVGRKDVMISIQEDGVMNVMTRRGKYSSGFPFETNQMLSSGYFLNPSNTLSNATISVLSHDGLLSEVNLEGDVVKREQLIKNESDARFSLIEDRGKRSFIIVRKEGSRYEVLDETGNLLFQKDYLSQAPILVQYYQFGAGRDVVAFTDTANQSVYLYDKSGNLMTGNSLNSQHEISLLYSSAKRQFQVFTTWGSALEVYEFKY